MIEARLTKEQADRLCEHARMAERHLPTLAEALRQEYSPGMLCHAGNANAWSMLVLDLIDRAEQAEADRATLAKEVRQNRASERILLAAALAAGQTNERTAKATDASGALDRAKENP